MGTRLAEADISIIKAQLEAVGQVHFASIDVFPDALRIDIKEYKPVMRLVIEEPNKERQLRIVSRVWVRFIKASNITKKSYVNYHFCVLIFIKEAITNRFKALSMLLVAASVVKNIIRV